MEITVALAQMAIALDRPDLNESTARDLADQAAVQDADLLVLPELWPTGYNLARAAYHAAPLDGGPFALMAGLARTHRMYVVGTALESNPGGLPFNTAALYGPDGGRLRPVLRSTASLCLDGTGQAEAVWPGTGSLAIPGAQQPARCAGTGSGTAPLAVAAYRKVHLFPPMGEVEYLAPGEDLPTFELPWGRTALSICYDLRFPEMWRRYTIAGAQLIVISAEWPVARVEHWRLLLRARAVENQLFVVGCNRAGQDADGKFGGHSAAVDPMGQVIVEGGLEPGLFVATLDMGQVAEVRHRFPFLYDRRPEVYG